MVSPKMKISDVARQLRLTHRAIRFYEEQGLISTSRGNHGYRLYDTQALDRLNFVIEARAVGITIRELQALARSGVIDDEVKRRDVVLKACTKCLDQLELKRAQVEAVMMRQPTDFGGILAERLVARAGGL